MVLKVDDICSRGLALSLTHVLQKVMDATQGHAGKVQSCLTSNVTLTYVRAGMQENLDKLQT
jgi:hypothetical protein